MLSERQEQLLKIIVEDYIKITPCHLRSDKEVFYVK